MGPYHVRYGHMDMPSIKSASVALTYNEALTQTRRHW